MVQQAKLDYKKKDKQVQVYSDLKDLAEMNPAYPGLKELILEIEYEMEVMKNIVQYRTDVMKFAGAYFKVLRGIPNNERPHYIVSGESFGFWRSYIQKGLKCLDRLIDKCK